MKYKTHINFYLAFIAFFYCSIWIAYAGDKGKPVLEILFKKTTEGKVIPYQNGGEIIISKSDDSWKRKFRIPHNNDKITITLPGSGTWEVEKKHYYGSPYFGKISVNVNEEDGHIKKNMILVLPPRIKIKGKLITEKGTPVYPGRICVMEKDKKSSTKSTDTDKDGSFFLNLTKGPEYTLHLYGRLIKGIRGVKRKITEEAVKKDPWIVKVPEAKLNIIAEVFYKDKSGKEIPYNNAFGKKLDGESIGNTVQLEVASYYYRNKSDIRIDYIYQYTIEETNKVLIYDLDESLYSVLGVTVEKNFKKKDAIIITKKYPVISDPEKFWIKKDAPVKRIKVVVGQPKTATLQLRVRDIKTNLLKRPQSCLSLFPVHC